MFQKGELIFYNNSGACRVEAVGPLEGARGADRERSYYTLSLLHGGGPIFAPVNSQVFMRPILSAEAANALIDTLPSIEASGWNERGVRSLSDHYHEAFQSHRSEDLLQLMKDIYVKSQESLRRGKRLGMIDQTLKRKRKSWSTANSPLLWASPLRRWRTISPGGWSPGRRKKRSKKGRPKGKAA